MGINSKNLLGKGLPINAMLEINSQEDVYLSVDGGIWLRSGVQESDTSVYPEATVSEATADFSTALDQTCNTEFNTSDIAAGHTDSTYLAVTTTSSWGSMYCVQTISSSTGARLGNYQIGSATGASSQSVSHLLVSGGYMYGHRTGTGICRWGYTEATSSPSASFTVMNSDASYGLFEDLDDPNYIWNATTSQSVSKYHKDDFSTPLETKALDSTIRYGATGKELGVYFVQDVHSGDITITMYDSNWDVVGLFLVASIGSGGGIAWIGGNTNALFLVSDYGSKTVDKYTVINIYDPAVGLPVSVTGSAGLTYYTKVK